MEIELGFQPRTPMDMISEISKHKFDEKISVKKPADPISSAEARIAEISELRELVAEYVVTVQAEQGARNP